MRIAIPRKTDISAYCDIMTSRLHSQRKGYISMSFKYIFQIKVRPGEDAEFIRHWHNGSVPIQKSPGALGTRLHKKLGEDGVYIAIAEWASKEARAAAFASLDDPNNPLAEEHSKWKENEDFGEVTLLAEVEEIDRVFPPY